LSICLTLAGGAAVVVASSAFTLSWTHSVERTGWHERWSLVDARSTASAIDPEEGTDAESALAERRGDALGADLEDDSAAGPNDVPGGEGLGMSGTALELVEARVRGSGAGMDPGAGARLEGGWWVWMPDLPPVPELVLAMSGSSGGGWTLCGEGGCREFGAEPGEPVVLAPCAAESVSSPPAADDEDRRATTIPERSGTLPTSRSKHPEGWKIGRPFELGTLAE